MKWSIQAADPSDATDISKLTKVSKAFWGYSDEQMSEWDEVLTISQEYIEENIVFKLIVDLDLVAYYSMIHVDEKHIKLDNLFVHPEHMKNGLGSLLLGEAISLAQELGYQVMILDADPNSKSFYDLHGFVEVDQKESSIEGRYLPVMGIRLG